MNALEVATMVKKVSLTNMVKEFREAPTYSRPVIILWGPAGSGKTKTITISGTEVHLPVINIRLGQEMAEDMSYPTTAEGKLKKIIAEMWPRYLEDPKEVDKNGKKKRVLRRKIEVIDGEERIVDCVDEYQIDFASISGYVENFDEVSAYYESIGLTINDAPGGIVFLDEINRIEDKQMFQMVFQLFESGTFKGFQLPQELSLFGACNPPKGYIVAPWFDDKAFANRCIHLKMIPEKEIMLEIARKAGYSELSLELVTTYPDLLFFEDDNDFKLPKTTRSFRNLSFFETFISRIDWSETEHPEMPITLMSAIYGEEYVHYYYSVLEKTAQKAISPESIFTTYDEYDMGKNPFNKQIVDDEVEFVPDTAFQSIDEVDIEKAVSKERKIILQATNDNKADYLARIANTVTDYIINNIDNKEFQKQFQENNLRFLRFALDLPRDTFASMISTLSSNEFEGNEYDFISLIDLDSEEDKDMVFFNALLELNKTIEKNVLG